MNEADRRRELSREYKQTARPMGIFRVRNLTDGATFLGSSVDLPAMLNRQRFQLEAGGHPSRALQRDWTAQRGEAFEIAILDVLEPAEDAEDRDLKEDLAELLAMWRQRLESEGVRLY